MNHSLPFLCLSAVLTYLHFRLINFLYKHQVSITVFSVITKRSLQSPYGQVHFSNITVHRGCQVSGNADLSALFEALVIV